MQNTKVRDVMTSNPVMVAPEDTLSTAACIMRDQDCGVLPVGIGGHPQGMITDRDIVVRAVCEGKDPATSRVQDFMTKDVCICKDTDTLADAAKKMHDNEVSRLIVVNEEGGAVAGILTFGSILRKHDDHEEVSNVVACATGKKAAA